jgi:drug/metabolite transporter (DMT)-like permease
MKQSRPRRPRHIVASILGGLFLLLACLLVIAGLLYGGMLFVASLFFPGGRWDGLTDTIVIWVIALVALFGLSRLSYAWASDPEPVPPFSGRTDSKGGPTDNP